MTQLICSSDCKLVNETYLDSIVYLDNKENNTREISDLTISSWYNALNNHGQLSIIFLDIDKICTIMNKAPDKIKKQLCKSIKNSSCCFLADDLIKKLSQIGFCDIKVSDTTLLSSFTHSEIIAYKKIKISIDHQSLKDQNYPGYYETFDLNTYMVSADEIKGTVVLDIGANIGLFSLMALELGAKKVLAIEPQKTNFEKLCANIVSYDQIDALNFAVYHTDNVQLRISDQANCSNIYQHGDPVSTISIQTLLDTNLIDDNNLVMKIDCEGAEFDILPAMSNELLRRFKVIYMEIHDLHNNFQNLSSEIVYNKLKESGFYMATNWPLIDTRTYVELGVYVQKWIRQ